MKRSVFEREMKKCNTISTSFSMQNEHSLSSLGDSHSHTYKLPVSTAPAPLEQLWGEERRPAREHFNGNC